MCSVDLTKLIPRMGFSGPCIYIYSILLKLGNGGNSGTCCWGFGSTLNYMLFYELAGPFVA